MMYRFINYFDNASIFVKAVFLVVVAAILNAVLLAVLFILILLVGQGYATLLLIGILTFIMVVIINKVYN